MEEKRVIKRLASEAQEPWHLICFVNYSKGERHCRFPAFEPLRLMLRARRAHVACLAFNRRDFTLEPRSKFLATCLWPRHASCFCTAVPLTYWQATHVAALCFAAQSHSLAVILSRLSTQKALRGFTRITEPSGCPARLSSWFLVNFWVSAVSAKAGTLPCTFISRLEESRA